jgi:hypothetical protein
MQFVSAKEAGADVDDTAEPEVTPTLDAAPPRPAGCQ